MASTLTGGSESRKPYAEPVETDPEQTGRAELRARHSVRGLWALEESFGLDRLPGGVFGFTFSPAYQDAPVFRDSQPHAFEVHKLRDGRTLLVGFMSAEQAAVLRNSSKESHVFLHPRAVAEAPELVSIPASLVTRYKDYRPEKSPALEIMVVPPELSGRGSTPPSFRLDHAIASAPRV